MPTFGTWEDVVLEHCFDHVEFISLHTYLNNYAGDTAAFLASPDLMDSFIEEVVAIADAVAARRRSSKRIMLSFDEWNVWYRTRRGRAQRVQPGWPVAPPILEEVYTMADALTFGGACISLLNHADRVKVRVPGPAGQRDRADHDRDRRPGLAADDLLPVRPDEPLRPRPRCCARRSTRRPTRPPTTIRAAPRSTAIPLPAVPYLKLAAVTTSRTAALPVRAEPLASTRRSPLEVTAKGFSSLALEEALELRGDLEAVNTKDDPERIRPTPLDGVTVEGNRLRATLAPASWNLIRLAG